MKLTWPSSVPPAAQPKMKKLLSKLPISTVTHENIWNVPNILTFSRLLAAPLVGYFIVNGNSTLALSLFAYAGITDLVDGWIARKWSLQTVVGTVIDPMADKALMTISVVCLAIQGGIPRRCKCVLLELKLLMTSCSISGSFNSWTRCWSGYLRYLLSLDFITATKDDG